MRLQRRALIVLPSLVLVCLGSLVTLAQNAKVTSDDDLLALENKVAQFLEGISLGQLDAAYDDLLDNGQILKQVEAVADLKGKTKELTRRYGRYQSFERVAAKRIGQDVVLLRYLYKCEQFPVVWYFTFYRTGSVSEVLPSGRDWRLIALRFDTQIELLSTRD